MPDCADALKEFSRHDLERLCCKQNAIVTAAAEVLLAITSENDDLLDEWGMVLSEAIDALADDPPALAILQ